MGARFSTPIQTGSVDHPAYYTNDTMSVPVVKQPGCGVDDRPPPPPPHPHTNTLLGSQGKPPGGGVGTPPPPPPPPANLAPTLKRE